MRLDRFICKSTELNRDQATRAIEAGEVVVNGEMVTEARQQVHESNLISLNGESLTPRPSRYLMLHKTAGTVCSNSDGHYPSVLNGLDIERVEELHIAGRLDADTTGLVLVTDDGRWSFNIISPKMHATKVYRVGLRDPLADGVASRFAEGLWLQGEEKPTLPATLQQVTEREVLLSITEGRYHQVKRMFAAVGNRVVSLHREQVGEIRLDIAEGEWRYLTETEVACFAGLSQLD
ncbi:pseudouridine synthase [Marinobacterium jannaschii]|uniref:pseudouridine synthase n=1 Tax=Marinobacterium jannaschii TaxID=64970 RepID=UPI000483100C|nr:pseudouridine synthase [Marinobacterium jannaschii]